MSPFSVQISRNRQKKFTQIVCANCVFIWVGVFLGGLPPLENEKSFQQTVAIQIQAILGSKRDRLKYGRGISLQMGQPAMLYNQVLIFYIEMWWDAPQRLEQHCYMSSSAGGKLTFSHSKQLCK